MQAERSDVLNSEGPLTAEKKMKGWTRKKKMQLIKSLNPEFKDLMESETSSEILR